MANSRETMNGYIEYLSKRLAGYCIFINDKHKLLVIAPQKCGSTSIFKSLYDNLVEPSREYEKTFSHEYTKELCIHTHLKSTQDSSTRNLKRIFADENYKKILVIRDPIDRLCSSICSKYLLESTPFYQREIKDKRINKNPLLQPYTNTDNFLDNFNEIANILLTKGSIFKNEKASHASPISEIVPREILPFLDKIDITKKEGWTELRIQINKHLGYTSDTVIIDRFPHVNENPLSNSRRFLSTQNLAIACGRYSEDFSNFKLAYARVDEHQQSPPSNQELKSINTFLSLANRAVELHSLGKEKINKIEEEKNSIKAQYSAKIDSIKKQHTSELDLLKNQQQAKIEDSIKDHISEIEALQNKMYSENKEALRRHEKEISDLIIKNKQLVVLEELSRRTAEELLIESRALKELNLESKEEIKRISIERDHQAKKVLETTQNLELELPRRISSALTGFFPFYDETIGVNPSTLRRRAEKRIKNKNYKSAQELLIQAYCLNKSSFNTLLRLLAVSAKNPFLRSFMLWITSMVARPKKFK
ncbi:sulfotransferase family protein [Synechococcus sp. RS9907]|nr:sulfotransferase family protein [Synechococcus sp. RS9907]